MPKSILALVLVGFMSIANAQTYTVTVHLVQEDGFTDAPERGHIDGLAASYNAGAQVSLTAVAETGYEFDHWEDYDMNNLGTNTQYQFNISDNTELWAIFKPVENHYMVTVLFSPEGADSVCSVIGAGQKSEGESFTLTADDNNQYYSFSHWAIGGASTGVTNIVYNVYDIHDDLTITAVFDYIPQDRTITVASNNPSRGTVQIEDYQHNTSTSSLTITERTQVTLTATAASSAYRFAGWFYNDEVVSTENPYTFNLPDGAGDRTYTANFANASDAYTMSAVYEPSEAASTKTPNPSTAIQVGNSFTYVTAAAANWVFDGWYDENDHQVTTSTSYTISVVNRNRTLTAKFHHDPYTISATANPTAAGIVNIDGANNYGTYDAGSSPVLTAVANTGYRFINWTGDFSSTTNPYTISNISRNYSNIVANFIATHTITLTNATLTSVSTTPHDGRYDHGTTIEVTANQLADHAFSHWTVNGVDDPTANVNPYTSTLNDDITLEPNYTPIYNVVLYKNPADAVVTLSGNGSYLNGESATIEVTYNPANYTFERWTIAGTNTEVSTENPYTFPVTSDIELTAQLSALTHYYSVTTSIDGTGSIRSDQLSTIPGTTTGIAQGSTIVINYDEVPNSGWRFQKWVVNGVDNTNTSCRIENISSDVTVQAVFRETSVIHVTTSTHPVNDPNITVTGGGEYASGANVTLTATCPIANYHFWVWMVNGEPTGTPNEPTLTLNNVTTDLDVVAWYYIPAGTAAAEILEFNADSTEVIRVKTAYRSLVTSIAIPSTTNGVSTIRDHAFDGCTNLEHLELAPTVTTIGKYAFANCVALQEMEIPNANATIDSFAFYNCASMRSVVLPANITTLKGGLFQGCSALADATIPAQVATIEGQAFMGCRSIYSLELPASVRTVGNQAFMGMNTLRFVTVNEGVTSFGEDCFERSNLIAQTNYNGSLAEWCNISFANAAANPAAKSHNFVLNGEMINKLVIPQGVTEIKDFAFYYNIRIDTIVLPEGLTAIDSMAFYRLTNLKRIVLNGNPAAINVHADAFSAVNKNDVVVEVPCAYYTAGMSWEGFSTVVATGMPVLKVVQRPGGVVTITHSPACNDNEYYYTVTATPATDFVFLGWSDGTGSSHVSYDIYLTADMTISPLWGHSENAADADGKIFRFEEANADASWFSMNAGANEWTIGNATHSSARDQKSLYVSNDGGAHNTYSLGSSPYTYTELLFDEGLYEIRFNAQVSNVPGHFLTAALIAVPDDIEQDDYEHLDPHGAGVKMLLDSIQGDGTTWNIKSRMVEISSTESGWYRLAFFWNVTNDNEVATTSAAVDNIRIGYLYDDELDYRHVVVNTSSNDDAAGYTHTGSAITSRAQANEDSVYFYGQSIEIHAYPVSGYRFVKWNDGNTEAHRTLNFVELYNIGVTNFTAIFEQVQDSYTVTVTLNNNNAATEYGVKVNLGSAQVAGVMRDFYEVQSIAQVSNNEDASVVLNEIQPGWAFMGWADENGDTISIDNPFVYTGRNDIHLTALLAEYQECPDLEYFFINSSYYPRMPRIDNNDIVNNVEIRIVNGQVVIENSGDLDVTLYDVNGRALQTSNGNGNNVVFDVPVSGSYLVSVGNLLTRRVVVIR